MFRAIISPIFMSTRLCVTACGKKHPRCYRPVLWKRGNWIPPLPDYRSVTSWVLYTTSCNTQSSAHEDGRNYRPKHVELIGIINKPLLLHLVGCLCCLYQRCKVNQTSNHKINSVCCWCSCCVLTSTFQSFFKWSKFWNQISGVLCSRYKWIRYTYEFHEDDQQLRPKHVAALINK